MTRSTPTRSRRVLQLVVVGVLAITGWFVGRLTRDAEVSQVTPSSQPAARGAVRAAELPSLAAAVERGEGELVRADQYHPRPPDEWQGMLVDMSQRQYCEASSFCGFALACLDDNACGPCQRDDQCASGEVCVLDHCVLAKNAGCRSRQDCAGDDPDALCVLSGLTGGEARGNGDMTSYCQSSRGGVAQDEAAPDPRREARLATAAAQSPEEPPVSAATLRERLDAELAAPRAP
jgi:hypothetical protein